MAPGPEAAPPVEAVLREHGAMIARIASSYERDPQRRQDLLQDISIALWRALPGWRGEAALRTFVARIAHYRGVDHVAGAGRHRHDALDEALPDLDQPGPLHMAEAHDNSRRLLAVIRRLPLSQRQALVLALEGFSQREIAQALGLQENAVAQRISRARSALKQLLEESP